VTLSPWIVGAPARAARFATHAVVEDVTSREVAVGPLRGRKFRRISLLAAQAAEGAKEAAIVLGVAVACRECKYGDQY